MNNFDYFFNDEKARKTKCVAENVVANTKAKTIPIDARCIFITRFFHISQSVKRRKRLLNFFFCFLLF